MALISPIISNSYHQYASQPIMQPLKKTPPLFEFKVKLPKQEYKQIKIIPIPFDTRECNGGRFLSLNDAMIFICKHCYAHHSSFSRSLATMYLPFCRIMKFTTGKYELPIHLKKSEFEEAFSYSQQKAGTF